MKMRHLWSGISLVFVLIFNNFVYAQGTLTGINVQANNQAAGAAAVYKFTFTTGAGNDTVKGIPENGKVEFHFPATFDISAVEIAASNNTNLTGGFLAPQINGQIVTVQRDSTGNHVPQSTSVTISLGVVTNTTVAANYSFTIVTKTASGDSIDSGTFNNFVITSAPLDHFQIDVGGNATAGQNYNITIYARDIYDNLVTSFASPVDLIDQTNTISPNTSGAFTNGAINLDVTFQKAYSGNTITAIFNNVSTTSSSFDVLHAALDHFSFDHISSPKTAGSAFLISITAYDQFENQVTDFNDKVQLSDLTGSLNVESANFTSGRLENYSVTITTSKTDNAITALYQPSGKLGQSNYFNVNPGSLAKFYISNIPSPQTAGEFFTVTVIAQDSWDNTVTDFSSKVTIADLSGTITPTESGNFVSGQWSGNLMVRSAFANNQITVTKFAGSESGVSNTFNVVHGQLDHFSISSISSPQTAGNSFTVTIQALDSQDNLVESFLDKVTLTDLTNSISPTQTDNFTNGQWTGTITITKSITNNKIFVSGNGKSGESNSFNVNASSLHHFSFDQIAGNQSSGTPFSVTLKAYDEFNNLVDNFNDNVDISDQTGTLTPNQITFTDGVGIESVTIYKSMLNNKIIANHSSSGKGGESNYFNVAPASVHSIKIRDSRGGLGNEIGDLTLTLGEEIQLFAAGYDEWGNYVREVGADWSVTGTLDMPNPASGTSTLFKSITPLTSGQIHADSIGLVDDYTGTITVAPIASIKIIDRPNTSGAPISDVTITADDSLTLYAAAFDADDNFIGLVEVDWSSTGGLRPIVSSTDSIYIFQPTKAGVSGQIVADLDGTLQASTGTISVTPGAPFGQIELHPEHPIIAAHPDSFTIIISDKVVDRHGNYVGEGKYFLVKTTAGNITTPDERPDLDGHWISTNSYSRLYFQLNGNTEGGNALISVSSAGEGSAFGDTTVIISGLDIVSVEIAPQTVTQGQQKIDVNMLVANRGTIDITLNAAGLEFWGTEPGFGLVSNKFTVVRTDTISKIIGQTQEILTFQIDVANDAPAQTIKVDGYVVGLLNEKVVRDDSAKTIDHILVQTKPNLILENISNYIDTLIQGTTTTISASIRNTGDATAVIQRDSLFFWAKNLNLNVSHEYGVNALPANAKEIPGHSAITLNYAISAGANATIDTITISGKITAMDKNSGEMVVFNSFEPEYDGWWVHQASDVEIIDFKPSQFTVTRGQSENWQLIMVVENRGGIDLVLDSLDAKFTLGGKNISSEYTILKDTIFANSQDDTLRAGAIDSLAITVDETGTSLGIVTVEGFIFLNDKISGTIIKNTATGVTVQSEANVSIDFIRLSQNEVTAKQSAPWTISVGVTNYGGGDVAIDTTQLDQFIAFGNDTSYKVTLPDHFLGSSDWTLPSGESDSLLFRVDTTGYRKGIRNLFVKVIVKELNSQRIIVDQDTVQFLVEAPTSVKIETVKNLAPNAPFVDTNQQFPVAVILKNEASDAAEKVYVSLFSDSISTISPDRQIVEKLESAGKDTALFIVTASSIEIAQETFTARIDSIVAENTPEPDMTVTLPAQDSSTTAIIQLPGLAKIDSVYTSMDTVKALSRKSWEFYISVRNVGKAPLVFNKPNDSTAALLIQNSKQNDYSISLPAALEHNNSLKLDSGEQDRFVFIVTQNGFKGGKATVKVNLTGKYLNTGDTFSLTDSTNIYVLPSADLYIDATEPFCPNISELGIGMVNVSQGFSIQSRIRNSGNEQVDSVIVKLKCLSSDCMATFDTMKTIQFIPPGTDSLATFNVYGITSLGQKIFSCEIISGIAHESHAPAVIGSSSDSTAFVFVQTPASLQINVENYTPVFTAGQNGILSLKIENNGSAETDDSGKLYVQVPPGYYILKDLSKVQRDTVNFIVDETINFQIEPPNDSSENDTIRIELFKPSLDKNLNLPAQVVNPFKNLIVKTVPSNLYIQTFQIISPAGALDDTLSTEQNFIVKLQVNASENLDSLKAAITLPTGFGLVVGEDSVKSLAKKSAQWQLVAPTLPTVGSQFIKVRVTGKADGQTVADVDSFQVTVVPKAILVLENVWISWPSQTISTLSTGQEFNLSVLIASKNSQQAGVTGPAALRVNFGSTGITTQEPLIKPFFVDSTIVWRLKAPEVETGKRPLTVFIENIPFDENTNAPAEIWSGKTREDFYVQTVAFGNININDFRITSPSGATDKVLSTRQNFTVEAQLEWQNLSANPMVTLKLPEGFTTAESNPKQPGSQTESDILSWTVRAPETRGEDFALWLEINASDANSGQQISISSDSIIVNVVERAEIQLNGEIISPNSAKDNIVSPGEEFTISSYLSFSGDAKATGNFTATIDLPQDRGYTVNGSRTKTVKADQWITWNVRAPLVKQDPANILIKLISPPEDENTNEPISLDAISSDVVAIPITTEEISVTISVLPQPNQNTQTRGGKDITLLRLQFDVSGDDFSNNVILSGVKLKIKNRFNELISNPASVLAKIEAVDGNNHQKVFASLTNIPETNPITLSFTQPDSLKPLEENIIDFVADISNSANIDNFSLAIDSSNAIMLYIAGSGIVPTIRTDSGESGQILGIESQTMVLVDADMEKSFSNYPNPFGTADRPTTNFVYYLDSDTDLNLSIYTLTGELVWRKSFTAAEPQGRKGMHNGDIVWDARNGNGKRVLNGVYIAHISTGSGKEAIVKVVVIK